MAKKQEFICAHCGLVTDTIRSVQCSAMGGGPHSWSAIPLPANQEVYTSDESNFIFSPMYFIIGGILVFICMFIKNPHISLTSPELFAQCLVGAFISAYFLKIIVKIALGFAFLAAIWGILYITGLLEKDEKKPNNHPPKVLKVNK